MGAVYAKFCIEHNIPLDGEGHCPKCRDANGNPFVLDMQSYYLAEPNEPLPFSARCKP
jgi:hypothetical protein